MCSATCSAVFELAGVDAGCSLFNVICCLFHSLLVNKSFLLVFIFAVVKFVCYTYLFFPYLCFCLFRGSLSLLVFVLHQMSL